MKNPLKLLLGTVQFGIPYGINNLMGIPADDEIGKILFCAQKAGIKFLDTAPAYGNAEAKIADLSNHRFGIITKFSKALTPTDIINQLETSLKNLQVNKLYGYMAHNADEFIQTPDLWKGLLAERDKGNVTKIGYSLYTTEQLERLLGLNFIPDIIQLPYSLLDRKFEPFLAQLKSNKTEIHIRSVFLQGLYFMDPASLPEKIAPLRPALSSLYDICNDFNISMASLALNFVVGNPLVDYVVIGVDTARQLEENLQLVNNWHPDKNMLEKISNITVKNKELLNPSNW